MIYESCDDKLLLSSCYNYPGNSILMIHYKNIRVGFLDLILYAALHVQIFIRGVTLRGNMLISRPTQSLVFNKDWD